MQATDFLAKMVSPDDHSVLRNENGKIISAAGKAFDILAGGKIDFLGTEKNKDFSRKRDFADRIKAAGKKILGKSYILAVHVIAPVMPRIHWPSFQTYWKYLAKKYSEKKELVIQIGSGNERINDKILNIDIFNFPEVDIVADCTRLPFPDESVDGVVSFAVLEHVEDPDTFLKEAKRVLKPGGFIITGVPFMQGFHSSPDDYYRWTHHGLERFHKKHGFRMERMDANSGPTSGMLWILQEWLSVILSFGISPLYYFWSVIFLVALFPVKILDQLFIYYPQAYKINSFFIYTGKKE